MVVYVLTRNIYDTILDVVSVSQLRNRAVAEMHIREIEDRKLKCKFTYKILEKEFK